MNKNFNIIDNVGIVKINREIYPKEVIMQTTYVLLEKYYFFVDLDKKNFIIEIRPKENSKIKEEDILIFLDELIESSSYIDQLKRTGKIREIILEKALLSQSLK